MLKLKRLVAFCFVLPALLALAACGLPDQAVKEAKQVKTNLDSLNASLKKRQADFAKMKGDSKQWEFFGKYAERENWADTFKTVGSDVAGLRSRYDHDIQPILDNDDPDDVKKLAQLVDGIAANFKPLRQKMNSVANRMNLLREGYEKAASWNNSAHKSFAYIKQATSSVSPVIAKAKTDFPERAADIDKRFAPIVKVRDNAEAALKVVEAEFAKHQSKQDADYAAFADSFQSISAERAEIDEKVKAYGEELASLYKDYTVILRDMKVEYWVKPQQETWCDYTDCWGNTNEFPMQAVDQTRFERITTVEEMTDDMVRGLGLDPNNDQGWGRDGRSWYIADWEVKYFHKYAEVNGTTVTEGDWEEVDEADYGAHADDFGMAIETKKLGKFEDEAVAEATPPGMDMVGDTRYGHWETDNDGRRHWSFLEQYAMYHLLFGGSNNYYYDDYGSYRSWREERRRNAGSYGWYGSNRSRPTYGSSGSYTTNTASYKSSPFGRSGGVKSVSKSVRSAGRSVRSRGPGSAGK